MFLHDESGVSGAGKEDDQIDENSDAMDEEEVIVENQCHLCMQVFDHYDLLSEHFESDHISFYNAMQKHVADHQDVQL